MKKFIGRLLTVLSSICMFLISLVAILIMWPFGAIKALADWVYDDEGQRSKAQVLGTVLMFVYWYIVICLIAYGG